MTARLDYAAQSPELFKKLGVYSHAAHTASIEGAIIDLVNIRASQLNGCGFCLDMHVKEATLRGERPLRLHHLAAWRESTLFSPRERACLAWTEVLTQLPRRVWRGRTGIGPQIGELSAPWLRDRHGSEPWMKRHRKPKPIPLRASDPAELNVYNLQRHAHAKRHIR